MLAGVTDCGRSQKWGCRGRLVLGFKNPGMSAKPGWGHAALARGCKHTALARGWDHVALVRVRTLQLWGVPFCHVA